MSSEQVAALPSVKLSNPEVITPEFWAAPYTRCRPFIMLSVECEDLSVNISLPYVGPCTSERCMVSWSSYSGSRCRELLPRMKEILDLADRTMVTIDGLFASNKERLLAEREAVVSEIQHTFQQREKARQERSAKRDSERHGDSETKKKKKSRTILVKKHVFPTASGV